MFRFYPILTLVLFSFLISCSRPTTSTGPAGKTISTQNAPTDPTNLRVETITDTSVQIAWDRSLGATDYDINYKKVLGGRWTNWPHRGTRLRAIITGLETNTEYRWAVRAENRDKASSWVFGENFTTLEDDSFDIELVFLDDFPLWEREQIKKAAEVWEKHLLDTLPSGQVYNHTSYCGEHTIPIGEQFVDDMTIYVSFLDEKNYAVGLASILAFREKEQLPAIGCIELFLHRKYVEMGRMEPDQVEGPRHEQMTQYVAAHEIGHVLGIGLAQDWYDFVQEGEKHPYFDGATAIEKYNRLPRFVEYDWNSLPGPMGLPTKALTKQPGGILFKGDKVPLARERIHWGETIGNEIMGNAPANNIDINLKVSEISLGALEDLGYKVFYENAFPLHVDLKIHKWTAEESRWTGPAGKRIILPLKSPFICGLSLTE